MSHYDAKPYASVPQNQYSHTYHQPFDDYDALHQFNLRLFKSLSAPLTHHYDAKPYLIISRLDFVHNSTVYSQFLCLSTCPQSPNYCTYDATTIRHSLKYNSHSYDAQESRTRAKYRARYFDTEMGRFVSRDPLGYVDGFGLYNAYFAQMFWLDPSGNCSKMVQNPAAPPSTNGCGPAPKDAWNKFKNWAIPDSALGPDFTSACDRHDICYGTCGSDKAQCDLNFLSDMRDQCEEYVDSLYSSGFRSWFQGSYIERTDRNICDKIARLYYKAVKDKGQGPFDDAQDEACICECEI